MLLSPLINSGLENLSDRKLLILCGILFYINCLSSWVFQNSFNPKGYSTMQFIMLYCLGYALKRNIFTPPLKTVIYVATTSLLVIIMASNYSWRMYYYSDPFVVLLSISLFQITSNFSFYNKYINKIAKTMLAVYLIQESLIGGYLYNVLGDIYKNTSTMTFIWLMILYASLLFLCSFIIEPLRRKFCENTIRKMSKLLNRYIILD